MNLISEGSSSKPREALIDSYDAYKEIKNKPGIQTSGMPTEIVPSTPPNYKIPKTTCISKVKDPLWNPQFFDVINSPDFKKTKKEYPVLMGVTEKGEYQIEGLPELNNLIIAGNPMSKKENFVDTVLTTMLLKYSPVDFKIILNDTTRNLNFYNGIPHLLSPVINEYDRTIAAFKWAMYELDRRLKKFSEANVRDIDSYNAIDGSEKMPKILIVSSWDWESPEITDALIRITSLGSRGGIYNFIVVNRLNDQSISSPIKANIPAKLIFKMSSVTESKLVGVRGAEKLELGEAIYKDNNGDVLKLMTIYTPEINIKGIVEEVKKGIG